MAGVVGIVPLARLYKSAGAPAEPVFTANAVAMPVPSPLTPVAIGSPVSFVSVPLAGVPSAGATNACPLGSVTVPVNVGDASVAFRARSLVRLVTPLSGNPVALVSVSLDGVPYAPPLISAVPPVPKAMELASVPVNVSELLKVAVLPLAMERLPSARITLELAPSGAFSSLITPLNCELVVAANCDNGLVVSASPVPPPAGGGRNTCARAVAHNANIRSVRFTIVSQQRTAG